MLEIEKHLLLAVVGKLIAAVVGVGIAKIHHLLPAFTLEHLLRAFLLGKLEILK